MRKASFLSCISLIALLVSASMFAGQVPAHQNKDPWFSSGSVIASVQIVPVPVQMPFTSTADWRVEQIPAVYISANDEMPIQAPFDLALNTSLVLSSVDVNVGLSDYGERSSSLLKNEIWRYADTIITARETPTAETQRTRAVRLY